MSKKLCITFDFDDSLSEPWLQELAQRLIDEGHDVWILTTRYDELHKHMYGREMNHEDLYSVAEFLGLKGKILFTNFQWKAKYLKDSCVDAHIDDNSDERLECYINKVKTKVFIHEDHDFEEVFEAWLKSKQ